MIDEDALPREIRQAGESDGARGVDGDDAHALSFALGTPLAEIEMRVIRETLRHTRGDKRLTAKLLGIATRTIYRRLEDAGVATDVDPDAEDGVVRDDTDTSDSSEIVGPGRNQ